MTKYYYILSYVIKPDCTSIFEENFGLVIKALKSHAKEQSHKMQLTRTYIGGEDTVTLTIALEDLEEIESWGHTPAVVINHYGPEKGMAILENYCKSMQRWESKVTRPYEIN